MVFWEDFYKFCCTRICTLDFYVQNIVFVHIYTYVVKYILYAIMFTHTTEVGCRTVHVRLRVMVFNKRGCEWVDVVMHVFGSFWVQIFVNFTWYFLKQNNIIFNISPTSLPPPSPPCLERWLVRWWKDGYQGDRDSIYTPYFSKLFSHCFSIETLSKFALRFISIS